jgi:hypothetical protein
VTDRSVLDLLSARQRVDLVAHDLDAEAAAELLAAAERLNTKFSEIERTVLDELAEMPRDVPIEDQFALAAITSHPSILHAMLDGDDYATAIWELIGELIDAEVQL